MNKGEFEDFENFEKYDVEVNGLSAGRFESTREAYLMKMSAEEEGDSCKIYCNGVDLTSNILLMGGRRGW